MEFNQAAPLYDDTFTNTWVGRAQRNQVWRLAQSLVKKGDKVLELNGGTGEDALFFLKKGCDVTMTDGATNMLDIAQQKVGENPFASFKLLDLKVISQFQGLSTYDVVFSNFGGLNCLSPEALSRLALALSVVVKPQGKLALVLMSKKCWWERLYYRWKGDHAKSNRRDTCLPMPVMVDGTAVLTYFYSPKEIITLFSEDFELVKTKPIGFFVPPSYLNSWFEKRYFLGKLLATMDRLATSFTWFSNYADHFYVEFKKK